MAILVGIDEAGFGPVLGPLLVAASVFEMPEPLLRESGWEILRRSVCKARAGSKGRLIVNDSKKVHLGRGNHADLQRGVLAFLATLQPDAPLPATVGQLLPRLAADCAGDLAEYPWYGLCAHDWPLSYDPGEINLAAQALSADMGAHKIRFHGLWACPLFEGHYNRLVGTIDNKSAVLFQQVSKLLDKACRSLDCRNLQILVDKQGGRDYYREKLQQLFPDLEMKVLKEGDTLSSYQLSGPGRRVKIHFIVKGDDRHLPIALASMAAKYVRELFMDMLNGYFQRHCPDILPTAGYYADGRRFLADLDSFHLPAHLAPRHLLVRDR